MSPPPNNDPPFNWDEIDEELGGDATELHYDYVFEQSDDEEDVEHERANDIFAGGSGSSGAGGSDNNGADAGGSSGASGSGSSGAGGSGSSGANTGGSSGTGGSGNNDADAGGSSGAGGSGSSGARGSGSSGANTGGSSGAGGSGSSGTGGSGNNDADVGGSSGAGGSGSSGANTGGSSGAGGSGSSDAGGGGSSGAGGSGSSGAGGSGSSGANTGGSSSAGGSGSSGTGGSGNNDADTGGSSGAGGSGSSGAGGSGSRGTDGSGNNDADAGGSSGAGGSGSSGAGGSGSSGANTGGSSSAGGSGSSGTGGSGNNDADAGGSSGAGGSGSSGAGGSGSSGANTGGSSGAGGSGSSGTGGSGNNDSDAGSNNRYVAPGRSRLGLTGYVQGAGRGSAGRGIRGHGRGVGGRGVAGRGVGACGRGRLGLAGRGQPRAAIVVWNAADQYAGVGRAAPNPAGRGRGRLALAGRGAAGFDLNLSASLEENVDDGADAGHGEPSQDPNGDANGGDIQPRERSEEAKQAIYCMILERTAPGKLSRGVTKEVSMLSGVPRRTVQDIWLKCKKAGGIQGVLSKKPKNCGRKRIAFDSEAAKQIDKGKRTTLRDLAGALDMSTTTVWRRLKEGTIRRHTNAIKSTLTDENKTRRVQWCLSQFEQESLPEEPTFNGMYNMVHIDEKWFYRTRKNQKFYLMPDEADPERTTQNKNFVEKVMFLAAVARPRYAVDGSMTFDGRIGIWPFTFQEMAKRDSPNRLAGTLVTKVVHSVTKEVSRQFMINKVLPAIKVKWPGAERGRTIFIQQDNARTHIAVNDPAFCAAASADSFDIRLVCQPPNSPDLNILDLGFFAALQSLFHKLFPNSLDDIVYKVYQAYYQYPAERSNRIFLTLQSCIREVLKEKGGQHYKVPHMRKLALQRLGLLPVKLVCDRLIVDAARQFLSA